MEFVRWCRAQGDRTAAVALVALGALCLILGWAGMSDGRLPAQQLPYLASGGLGGIILVALGSTLWLSADLRDEWRKIDRLEQVLAERNAADRAREAN